MFTVEDIITGEKLQELCHAYCGLLADFTYNPRILQQSSKHYALDTVDTSWNNPSILFCYGHQLDLFISKLQYIQNRFILVSHNSDTNITENYRYLADSPLLIKWYAQNTVIEHSKIEMIPIGIANSMWPHGRLEIYPRLYTITKKHDVYFNFNIHTNTTARLQCRSELEGAGLLFMNQSLPINTYLELLATYKYAICPPGNGIDSHRIWECYYCNVIPIIIDSVWARALKKRLPCIILHSWKEFNTACLANYDSLLEELNANRSILCFDTIKNLITAPL
jgi:hypothetical protein